MIRARIVASSSPTSSVQFCPFCGSTWGSRVTQLQVSTAAPWISSTRCRSCGLCNVTSCAASQRHRLSTCLRGPATPRTPTARKETTTGTLFAVGCSEPASNPSTRTAEGRSASPMRSDRKSSSTRRRSQRRASGCRAMSNSAAGSGDWSRRSLTSPATASAIRSRAVAISDSYARRSRPCRRRPTKRSLTTFPISSNGDNSMKASHIGWLPMTANITAPRMSGSTIATHGTRGASRCLGSVG